MRSRTKAQQQANVFDAELYGLICKAVDYQDLRDKGWSKPAVVDVNPWREVVGKLYAARLFVRDEMHPDDRKETE